MVCTVSLIIAQVTTSQQLQIKLHFNEINYQNRQHTTEENNTNYHQRLPKNSSQGNKQNQQKKNKP